LKSFFKCVQFIECCSDLEIGRIGALQLFNLLELMKNWSLLILISFLCISCSDFDTEWKKEPYVGTHFSNLVVVGLSHELEVREFYENEAVNEIRSRGFEATKGLSIFPQEVTELNDNQSSITRLIAQNNIDAVLVIKILHEDDTEFMTPEDYGKFKKLYFRRRSFHTYNTGYYKKQEKYYMIATLYDLKENHEENEETVIWRASNKIIQPSENHDAKKAFIDNAIDHIVGQHLIN
jgi:hypothetical protein